MSLWSRLANIFVVPGEVFEEVSPRPPAVSNWLVPTLLAAFVGIVFSAVIFSQPTIVQQVRAQQEKAIQAQVEAGKISQAQADRVLEATQKFMSPTLLAIFGAVGSVVGSFIWLFLLALILWLIGAQALKGQFGYLKAVEVCGLSHTIGVLGGIVTMLIVVIAGNLYATLGPMLLLPNFDPAQKTHLLLAAVNLMTLWEIAVLAIGLSKLTGASFLKSALWLFLPWAFFKVAIIFSGFGMRGF